MATDLTLAAGVLKGVHFKWTASVVDAAGDAADPAALTAEVMPPVAASTTYTYGVDAEVVKSATGVYYINVLLNVAGVWRVRWTATDANGLNDVVAGEVKVDEV